MSRLDLGPTKRIEWVPGFLLGLGHEFYHSPSSSAKVKNEWSCTSPPPVCLQGKGQFYVVFSMPHTPLLQILSTCVIHTDHKSSAVLPLQNIRNLFENIFSKLNFMHVYFN